MHIDVHDYFELTKPRIITMILVTAAIGYVIGGHGVQSWPAFLCMLLGTGLSAGGAGVLNNYLERDSDRRMKRTLKRPIPSGRVAASDALALGITLVLGGTALLCATVNLLTAFLAILTAFLYVLVYTPLKKITWLNTFVGAIPGAMPPMGGWAAATGNLDLGAWVLFLILFIWQHPHFYAIAWMYREDYARGGFKMLPVVEPDGRSTFRQILMYSFLLIPVSLIPTWVGMSGMIYFYGMLLSGFALLGIGFALWRTHSMIDARRLLKASVFYLPVFLILVVADSSLFW